MHGGVKPANVLVEEGGGVVLADYGLATVAERMGAPVSTCGGGARAQCYGADQGSSGAGKRQRGGVHCGFG